MDDNLKPTVTIHQTMRASTHSPDQTPRSSSENSPPVKMEHSGKKLGITCFVGVIFIILGLTLGIFWSSILNKFLFNQLSLTPSSKNYDLWVETPIPMYLKFHLFNWTNPEELSANSQVKPHFVEMGPYVFRQIDYKVNLVWNHDNDTVTFQRRRIWHFEESMSNGSLSDKVTNLNPVAATTAYTVRHKGRFLRDFVSRLLLSFGEKRVITRTVGELLFDGYNDTLLEIAKKAKVSTIPFDKFGWFYSRNGSDTYDGIFNMLTGTNNLMDLGMIKNWNFKNRTDNYNGLCGEIRGTNGDLWPPLPDNKTVSIFIPDICTALDLTYENSTSFQGLTGTKFISDKTMLDNGSLVDSRRCYCQNGECEPSGVLNISTCKFGAPAFVSLPHFYLADPIFRSQLSGMNPKKEHEMSLVVEPTTGVPMQVKAQLQLNLLIQPDKQISIYEDVPKLYVPMMWFSQEANLTSNYASQVKFLLVLPVLGHVTGFGVAGIGGLIFAIGIYLFVRWRLRGEEGQGLIPKNENNRSSGNEG